MDQQVHNSQLVVPNYLERTNFAAQSSQVDSIAKAELEWSEFVDLIAKDMSEERNRYIRINPDIGNKPPSWDAVQQIEQLRHVTRQALRQTNLRAEIRSVAHRLIASTFYFRAATNPISEPGIGDASRCVGERYFP